jgi:DNA-binding beta-propeller fold protein YncE
MDRRRFLGLAAATVLLGPDAACAAAPLLALATCDADARLAVVDVRADRIVRWIRCPPDPRSIELLGSHAALVCHTGVGAVSIVDGSSLAVRRVIRGFREPRYTAAHPDRRHAFVTDSGTSEVVAVDVVTGRRVGSLKLDEWARHVTVDPRGRRLWVGLGSASERVAIVDVSNPARPRLERLVAPPFLAHDVGYEPGGGRVWVTSGNLREVAVYDPLGRLRLRLPADAAPQHVTFADGAAYLTSGVDGTLRVLSVRTGHELRATRVPVGSYNVQSGDGLVLTPSLDTGALSVLDRAGRLVHETRVARSSHDACFLL